MDVDPQWTDHEAGSIASVWKQFQMKSKQFQMELQLTYTHSSQDSHCFYIGVRQDCQPVNL